MEIPKTVKIKEIAANTEFVKTFKFDYSVGAKPGQFVNLWIPRMDEKPFSVAYDDGKELWVTIFAVGPFSKKMHELKVGDQVGIRGPYGTYYEYEEGQHLALVAGGYGAAPFYFLATEALKKNCKIEFIVGARGQEHLLYLDEIDGLGESVKLHIATDDGSKGFKGYNVQLLQKLVDEGMKLDWVFACGPEMMLKSLSSYLADADIKGQLSLERYMKCAFGVCGHCAMDPLGLMVCKDGPVFDNDICKQFTEFGQYHRDKDGKKMQF